MEGWKRTGEPECPPFGERVGGHRPSNPDATWTGTDEGGGHSRRKLSTAFATANCKRLCVSESTFTESLAVNGGEIAGRTSLGVARKGCRKRGSRTFPVADRRSRRFFLLASCCHTDTLVHAERIDPPSEQESPFLSVCSMIFDPYDGHDVDLDLSTRAAEILVSFPRCFSRVRVHACFFACTKILPS